MQLQNLFLFLQIDINEVFKNIQRRWLFIFIVFPSAFMKNMTTAVLVIRNDFILIKNIRFYSHKTKRNEMNNNLEGSFISFYVKHEIIFTLLSGQGYVCQR